MSKRRAIEEAKKGSAELVILAVIEAEAHHGYEIAKLIEARTGGSLRFTLASLYSTLYRLEERGWIQGQWGELASGRRAKSYALTPAGRKQLTEEKRNWRKVNTAINQILAEEV